jgi:hypothetical protein
MEVEILREAAHVDIVDDEQVLGSQVNSDTQSISFVTHLD